MSERSGLYRVQPGGFKAFLPHHLPPLDLRLDQLLSLLSKADRAIGRLDAVSEVPNPDRFVFQYVRQEAVLSSQIEGTHASLMDLLEAEALLEGGERTVDLREVVNYVRALRYGLEQLHHLPISRRLLCSTHAVLMDGVRGGEPAKTPGGVRRSQNWIGGRSPASARFVPPPWEDVDDLFANLERFLHDPSELPPLLRIGIAHAQFETIHPFLDGNGRLGRLLITFWLIEQRILTQPLLYLSLHFKEHKDDYVERLQAIRDDGDWEGWLTFFLDGVAAVSNDAASTAKAINALREDDRARIAGAMPRGSTNALKLHDELFKHPVVNVTFVEKLVSISQPAANTLVNRLTELGILQETTGKRRGRSFRYARYLELFPGNTQRS